MPVHNGLPYLAEAIRSVQDQTLKDWELVVVDDGSSDGSSEAVSSCSDSRIRAFLCSHRGVSAARNYGLKQARGDYVLFLDSDDLLLPDSTARLAAYLDDNCRFGAVYSDGYIGDQSAQPFTLLSAHRSREPIGNLLGELAVSPNVIGANSCVMARRSAVEACGVAFDVSFDMAEDWLFWIMFAREWQFGRIAGATCVYRQHALSTTTRTRGPRRRVSVSRVRSEIRSLPEFDALAPIIRYRVLHETVLTDAEGDVQQQLELARSDHVAALPSRLRSRLLRLLASEWLLTGVDADLVRLVLDTAVAVGSPDWKLWVLHCLCTVSPSGAGRAVRWSRSVRSLRKRERALRKVSIV